MIILSAIALVGGGILAVKQPWSDSDHWLGWIILCGLCMYAFLAFFPWEMLAT